MLIISDIHGRVNELEKVLNKYHKKGDKILILGDILRSRGGHDDDTDVDKTIALLSKHKNDIIAVRGNCDTKSVAEQLPFPLHEEYMFSAFGKNIFMHHGDRTFHTDAEVVLTGHTHIWKLCGNSRIFCNPGSISLPRNNTSASFATIDEQGITIRDLNKKVLAERRFSMQKAVIFDLDGTILDTLPSIHISMVKALDKYNVKSVSRKQLALFLGQGIKKTIRKVLDKVGRLDLLDLIVIEFAKQYSIHRISHAKRFRKMDAVLDELSKYYHLGVITNKNHEDALAIINQFFPGRFSFIQGAESNKMIKPHKEFLSKALEHFKLTPQEIVYVGDAIVDYQFASTTGMDCIIALYGYGNKEELLSITGAKKIKKPIDIIDLLI